MPTPIEAFAELTLEVRDRHVHFAFSAGAGQLDALGARLRRGGIAARGPVEHEGGDRSFYVEDPEGNVVEVWDFFHRGEGADRGTGPRVGR
jgi:catechol 2,3-dioxygenase-like lactoylglutathione lyase family enzyme